MRPLRSGGAGWRLLAVLTLVLTLAGGTGAGVPRAAAATVVTVNATDEDGLPLAGATFAVYDAVDSGDGVGGLVAGGVLLDGPSATDADGTAVLSPPSDGPIAVVQVGAPDGYDLPSDSEQVIESTVAAADSDADGVSDQLLTFVSSAQTPVPGTVDIAVVDAATGEPLAGVGVGAWAVDVATGGRGPLAGEATSGGDGYATLTLVPGDYLIGVQTPPAGYVAAGAGADVVTTVGPGGDGLGDYLVVPLPLSAEVPTPLPTLPPTPTTGLEETAEPVETAPPPATDPADAPTETPADVAAPTDAAAPTDDPTPTSASDDAPDAAPTAPPDAEPATVTIDKLVCEDAARAGTAMIELERTLQDALDAAGGELPDECVVAGAGVTFTVFDPQAPEDPGWDDDDLVSAETGEDGTATLAVPVAGAARTVYLQETVPNADPNGDPAFARSDDFVVTPGGIYTALVVNFVAPPPPPTGELTVVTTDNVSNLAVPGGCFDLTAEGAPTVVLRTVCDGDDGADDGVVAFGEVDNGRYLVAPTGPVLNYVMPDSQSAAVEGSPEEVPVAATPYGTIEVLAVACPEEVERITFAVATPDALADDGTGGSGGAVDPGQTEGCTPVAANLVLYLFSDTAAVSTPVAAPANGTSFRAAVPPTGPDAEPHLLREVASGEDEKVPVDPANVTTVVVRFGGADIAGGSEATPPADTSRGMTAALIEADMAEAASVTRLPATGAGGLTFDTGGGDRWPLVAVLTLLTLACAFGSGRRDIRPARV